MRVTDGKVPENAALIDRYGRLIVNGKPFMPVGAFATLDGNLEKQVGRLQEAGLNSVIGYCNFAMKAAPAKKTQQENILAALDLLERSGIKSIFCVKECIPDFGTGESFDGVRGWLEPVREIARAIRKHPALLAWYIGDEVPVESMKDCSVVTATYELGEGVQGKIGIIGPKRMDYQKVVDTLKNTMSQLDDIFKKE